MKPLRVRQASVAEPELFIHAACVDYEHVALPSRDRIPVEQRIIRISAAGPPLFAPIGVDVPPVVIAAAIHDEDTLERLVFDELDPELRLAIQCADEKKAVNMIALDLRDIASFTEFFVIASGTNTRQVQAIADEINEQLKKQLQRRPVRVEGYSSAEWVLLDYGDFVVHLFDKDARDFYDLERLWRDAKRVDIPASLPEV